MRNQARATTAPPIHLHNFRVSKRTGLYVACHALSAKQVLDAAAGILEANIRGDALSSPDATRTYLRYRLANYPYEVFACLFLDNRHRVIEFEELFRGTINGTSVHPREVVRRSLYHNAAAVIFSHNHPSGVAEPSASDTAITTQLREALALIDVRVLDHVIVGEDEPVSLAERGLMNSLHHEPAPVRPKPRATPTHCKNCGAELVQPKKGRRVYCSPQCGTRWRRLALLVKLFKDGDATAPDLAAEIAHPKGAKA